MSISLGHTFILSLLIALLLFACGAPSAQPVQPISETVFSPSPTLEGTPNISATKDIVPSTLVAAKTAEPQTVALTSSKDNTLYEVGQGFLSNGSGQHIFVGKSAAGPVRRAVIAFDLAGNVPSGATITEATLTLNLSRTRDDGQVIGLHRLLADWGEGASDTPGNEGSGVPASDGDATWIYRSFDTEPWSQPGGDFESDPSGSVPVADPDRYSWGSTAAMVSDVQMWLDSPIDNFGWLLKGNEEEVRTTKRFDSRENESPENRPTLTITFILQGNP